MTRALLDEQGKQALAKAIGAIEAGSSVEVVLAVRRRSGHYLHASLIAGAVVGYATLAVLMLSPWPFATWAFLVDPLLLGGLAGLASTRLPGVLRVCSPAALRRAQVDAAAHATFHLKEVGLTHRRTGLLVYVSLLEREVVLIADKAITDAVEAAAWRGACAAIEAEVRRQADASTLAGALAGLAAPLARALPRQADDVNELPDEVDVA